MTSLSLEEALRSVSGKEDALDALLAIWRSTRSPEIAYAIETISGAITASLPEISGKTRAAFQEAWLDIANENRASDLGRLLATFANEPCTQIPDRLTRLEARDHDPRIARALWRLVGLCPCTSNPNFPWWTRLFKLLAETNDPRMREPLEIKLREKRKTGSFYEVLYPRIEKTLAAMTEDPPPLSKADQATLAALTKLALSSSSSSSSTSKKPVAKTKKKKSEEDLLALVYENPAVDDPRLVYADFLLERQDPRGEFISLQFKKNKSKKELEREKKLLKEHGRRWLGPLEPVIDRDPKAPFEFERGFLSSCRSLFKTKKQRALINQPAWRTLRAIDRPPVALVTSEHTSEMLRCVSGISQKEAAELASHRSPLSKIESLSFERGLFSEEMETIAKAAALPNLTTLEVHLPGVTGGPPPDVSAADLGAILQPKRRLASRLTHLSVVGFASYSRFSTRRPDLASWLFFVEKSLPKIQSVSFDLQLEWSLTITRTKKAWDLELRGSWYGPPTIETLEPIFAGLPRGTFASVRVVPNSTPEIDEVLATVT